MKKVRDYMERMVITFSPDDSIFDVAEVFSKLNISGAPVVDGEGNVVGVISETDVVKFMKAGLGPAKLLKTHPGVSITFTVLDLVRKGLKIKKELRMVKRIKVKDVMSNRVISINPDADVFEAAELMEKNKIHRLIVTEGGKLIGIISKADLLRALIR